MIIYYSFEIYMKIIVLPTNMKVFKVHLIMPVFFSRKYKLQPHQMSKLFSWKKRKSINSLRIVWYHLVNNCHGHWMIADSSKKKKSLIYSFNKYILSINLMPSTVLDLGYTIGNMRDKVPALMMLKFYKMAKIWKHR